MSDFFFGLNKVTEQASTLLNGLIFAYPMDESSGTDMFDSSVNELDGTLSSVTPNGSYYLFSTSYNNYCNIPDNSLLSPTEGFSFRAMLYPTNVTSSLYVFSKEGEYVIWLQGGRVFVKIFDNGGTDYTGVNAVAALSINTWAEVIVTYDGSEDEAGIKIYYDGSEQSYATQYPAVTPTMIDTANAARIGDPVFTGNAYSGRMKEVAFASRVWTSDERSELTTNGFAFLSA